MPMPWSATPRRRRRWNWYWPAPPSPCSAGRFVWPCPGGCGCGLPVSRSAPAAACSPRRGRPSPSVMCTPASTPIWPWAAGWPAGRSSAADPSTAAPASVDRRSGRATGWPSGMRPRSVPRPAISRARRWPPGRSGSCPDRRRTGSATGCARSCSRPAGGYRRNRTAWAAGWPGRAWPTLPATTSSPTACCPGRSRCRATGSPSSSAATGRPPAAIRRLRWSSAPISTDWRRWSRAARSALPQTSLAAAVAAARALARRIEGLAAGVGGLRSGDLLAANLIDGVVDATGDGAGESGPL